MRSRMVGLPETNETDDRQTLSYRRKRYCQVRKESGIEESGERTGISQGGDPTLAIQVGNLLSPASWAAWSKSTATARPAWCGRRSCRRGAASEAGRQTRPSRSQGTFQLFLGHGSGPLPVPLHPSCAQGAGSAAYVSRWRETPLRTEKQMLQHRDFPRFEQWGSARSNLVA
jgi:hypothetical protein